MNRLQEASHFDTSGVVLPFVPLLSRVARTPHLALFAGQVSREALRQPPQMESHPPARGAQHHGAAHVFGLLEQLLMFGIHLRHVYEIVGRPFHGLHDSYFKICYSTTTPALSLVSLRFCLLPFAFF